MTTPVCWMVRRRLGAYRDGELAPAARASTESHLARCGECAAELASLGRLRTALALELAEPSAATWDAFWPQVRARLAVTDVEPAPWRLWPSILGRPSLAFGSAVAMAAVVLLAVFGPWQSIRPRETPRIAEAPRLTPGSVTPAPGPGGVIPVSHPAVVVHSVETAPDSSAMVFSNPDADVTVVWVFGLEPTDI
jgi:Putative zinc-finger